MLNSLATLNFHDLNNACLKDKFPLLNIDKLVCITARRFMFSFIDGLSGCN